MSAQVFISHSSKDRDLAETICGALESRKIPCWISSRDVAPGDDFMESIVRAIRAAKVMVLVFTSNANNSDEIKRELVLASQHKLVIIPVRLEDVLPNDAFEYAFATRQWIDLFNDWERSIQRLAERITEIAPPQLGGQFVAAGPSPSAADRSAPGFSAALSEIRRSVWAVGFAIGIACISAICAVALAVYGNVRAAAVILGSILVAGLSIAIAAPFASRKNRTVRLAGLASAWTISALFVGFLAFAAIGILVKWPIATLTFGIYDTDTCERPSELLESYTCGPTDNGYVVINVRFSDADKGLNIRDRPSLQGTVRGTLPPNASDVVVTGECESGWCPVQCGSLRTSGWSQGRYLVRRIDALNTITGTNPREPGGLSIRSGPHESCRQIGTLPYQSRDVIQHICEMSPIGGSQQWCRITYKDQTGWVTQGYLERQQ